MLNDEDFNALEWVGLADIQELTGAKIAGVDPIGDGAASCCAIVLYLEYADGSKTAVAIDAPEELGTNLCFEKAPIKINLTINEEGKGNEA